MGCLRWHQPSRRSVSWIRRAAGAAVSPPVPPCETTTATAYRGRVRRGVGDEPRGVLRAEDLRGAGLARDGPGRQGEAGEGALRGALGHHAGQGVVQERDHRRRQPDRPIAGAGRRAFPAPPPGAVNACADLRGPERAAVGDGGVDARHLQRRHGDVALADGEVRGVTGAELEARLAVLHGQRLEVGRARPVRGRDLGVAACGRAHTCRPGSASHVARFHSRLGMRPPCSPGRSMPVRPPEPEGPGRGDERVARSVGRAARPPWACHDAVGEVVEDGVARDDDRPCAARSARRRATRSCGTRGCRCGSSRCSRRCRRAGCRRATAPGSETALNVDAGAKTDDGHAGDQGRARLGVREGAQLALA